MVDVCVVPAKTIKLDGLVYMLKFGVDVFVGVGEGVMVCADAKLPFGQLTSNVNAIRSDIAIAIFVFEEK
jgi:hypothetical protein